ncbi:histidine kinase [Ideonella sp. 4Y16]|uniref:histidine kinase n=1 Tax=Ideonella alba TaxID=2824118 RepID=A0A940YC87_9BURK|nr:histidine kinase [Ideonella alba]MBQ0932923.1 histidine kinase [Ideonella alba]MBQ0942670.1 histidine kinase [Ideonella alba]
MTPLPMTLRYTDFQLSLGHSLRATQGICLVVAAVLALLGMPWWVAVVYSLCIGNLTSLLVHLGRWGLAWWQVRRSGTPATEAQRHGWPGWGLMTVVIVLAVGLAYPLGSWIAGLLTGIHSDGSHQHEWRTWLGLFAISLVPAAVGTFYFRSRAHIAATEAALAQVSRQAAETELKMLQSQLEPHMLFNTLANLRALIGIDPARAQTMLDHMIAWLRSTLSASRRSAHPLADEFRHLSDYLALMRIRMGERLSVEIDLPADLADALVPPLLMQPLVENAIRHGLEPLRGPARLALTARRDGASLLLSVRDNGLGLGAARDTAGTGFGLTQVRERLATLYGEAAALSIADAAGGGTEASVRLPLTRPEHPTP